MTTRAPVRVSFRAKLVASHVAVSLASAVIVLLLASQVQGTESPQTRIAFACVAASIAAIVVAFVAARVAVRPLQAMTDVAARLGKGDYAVSAPGAGDRDEVGELGRALATLAAQLESNIGELVAERDTLSAILEGMAEGVLVLDGTRRVIVANTAVTRILGGNTSLMGLMLEQAVQDEAVRKVIITNTPIDDDLQEAEVESNGRSLAVYARPFGLGARGVVAVLRDLTEVRRLEGMRRDFVANVSHELRTPVAAIQGYAETLLGAPRDEQTQKQFLEIIHRQAKRIAALVEQLLALSDIESRRPEDVVRERVDVSALAGHVRETVRGRAEKRKANVVLTLSESAVVVGDPAGIERVIENLTDNAIKYGKKEGGTVTVEIKKDDDRIVTRVIDDGPGIEAKHLPRLFERFYRTDRGRSREQGGTGLGLAIVKHLVESMGGTIIVESAPGKGTVFIVTLPAAVGQSIPSTKPSVRPPGSRITR